MIENGTMDKRSDNAITPEEAAARRKRSIAIALGLAAFALLIFFVTLARLGANVLDRPL